MTPSDTQGAGVRARLAVRLIVAVLIFPLLAVGLGSLAGCAGDAERGVSAPADRVAPRTGPRGGRD